MIDVSSSFLATQEHTAKIFSWVRDQIDPLELKPKITYHIELCIEEVVVNIINYAYKNSQGMVDISIKRLDSKLRITFKDQGIPFNPISEFSSPDTSSKLEDRPIGGLGIHFMHELMDSVEYVRKGNSNVLIIEKAL